LFEVPISKDCSIQAESEFCDLSGQLSPNGDVVVGVGYCLVEGEEGQLLFTNDFNLVRFSPTK
jgi:hypothetical protein